MAHSLGDGQNKFGGIGPVGFGSTHKYSLGLDRLTNTSKSDYKSNLDFLNSTIYEVFFTFEYTLNDFYPVYKETHVTTFCFVFH